MNYLQTAETITHKLLEYFHTSKEILHLNSRQFEEVEETILEMRNDIAKLIESYELKKKFHSKMKDRELIKITGTSNLDKLFEYAQLNKFSTYNTHHQKYLESKESIKKDLKYIKSILLHQLKQSKRQVCQLECFDKLETLVLIPN